MSHIFLLNTEDITVTLYTKFIKYAHIVISYKYIMSAKVNAELI